MIQKAPATRRGWWRILLVLAISPFLAIYIVFVLVLIGFAYIHSESSRRWHANRLRSAMRKAGRVSSWADVEADLTSGIGTLIVDAPCIGWNDADLWWTRESVAALAKSEGIAVPKMELCARPDRVEFETRMKDPFFDRWCQARYFDASHGTAKLVQCTHWRHDVYKLQKHIEKLKAVFPKLESVMTCTWMVDMPAELQPPPGQPIVQKASS